MNIFPKELFQQNQQNKKSKSVICWQSFASSNKLYNRNCLNARVNRYTAVNYSPRSNFLYFHGPRNALLCGKQISARKSILHLPRPHPSCSAACMNFPFTSTRVVVFPFYLFSMCVSPTGCSRAAPLTYTHKTFEIKFKFNVFKIQHRLWHECAVVCVVVIKHRLSPPINKKYPIIGKTYAYTKKPDTFYNIAENRFMKNMEKQEIGLFE